MTTAFSGGRRAVVLGLDGVPYTLVRRFCDEGVMPRLRELIGEGTVAPMDTVIPEISSTAWASFMTGVNPGKHAVYGFMDLDPKTYKLSFSNFNSVRSATIWDYLSRVGRRSVVLNIPSTYPARDLIGVMVSGFVAIDLKRATFPSSLVPCGFPEALVRMGGGGAAHAGQRICSRTKAAVAGRRDSRAPGDIQGPRAARRTKSWEGRDDLSLGLRPEPEPIRRRRHPTKTQPTIVVVARRPAFSVVGALLLWGAGMIATQARSRASTDVYGCPTKPST